jgi:hypothetical protein
MKKKKKTVQPKQKQKPKPKEKEKTAKQKINEALDIALYIVAFGGEHHKNWAIHEIMRILAGKEGYRKYARQYKRQNGWNWDVGIAP